MVHRFPSLAAVVLLGALAGCVDQPDWDAAIEDYCHAAILDWHHVEVANWAAEARPSGWDTRLEPQADGAQANVASLPLAFGSITVQSVRWEDPSMHRHWPVLPGIRAGPQLSFDGPDLRLEGTFRDPSADHFAREDFAHMLSWVAGMPTDAAASAVEETQLGEPRRINDLDVRVATLTVRGDARLDPFLTRIGLSPDDATGWDGIGQRSTEGSWRVDYSIPVRQYLREDDGGARLLRVAADGTVEFVEASDARLPPGTDLRAREALRELGAPEPPWTKRGGSLNSCGGVGQT